MTMRSRAAARGTLAAAICAMLVTASCGGGDSPTTTNPDGSQNVVASIDITPSTVALDIGQTAQLSAVAKTASGATISGVSISWSSANSGVATVSSSGLVTGVASGTTTITAATGSIQRQVSVSVNARPRIALSASSITFTSVGAVTPAPQTVTITNSGAGTLDGIVTSVSYAGQPTGWLTTSLSTGTAPTQLTLQTIINGLTPGTYSATVTVSATNNDNGPQAIAVKLVVSGTAVVTLSLNGNGDGTVSASPQPTSGNLSCSFTGGATTGTCTATYASGTVITLTATPLNNSAFSGWGGACSGTGGCVITVGTTNVAVSATFTRSTAVLTVSAGGNGSGQVTSSPAGISCTITDGVAASSGCSNAFQTSTTVTLTAVPQAGSTFTGWSNACAGTGTCVVQTSIAKAVTASFTKTGAPSVGSNRKQ